MRAFAFRNPKTSGGRSRGVKGRKLRESEVLSATARTGNEPTRRDLDRRRRRRQTKSRNERVGANAGFIVMSTGSGTLVYAYVNTRQRSHV